MNTTIKKHTIGRVLSVLMIVGLFFSSVPAPAYAIIYQPGATLDPACLPTDINCDVAPGLTTNNTDSVNLGPIATTPGGTAELRFSELVANGTDYVGLKASDALAGNVVFTLPSADGTTGQVLSTSGTGALSWANANTSKISTIHHSVGTALAITPTHNNAEIHAENTGGFTIDGNAFTDDTFGAVILNTGGSSVTLTPSNFTGAFLRDGSSDVGFASLTIAADEAYSLTVTVDGMSKFLNVVTLGGGTKQWTTSGNNVYYSTGNVGIGTIAPGAELEVVGDIISTGTKWTERVSPSKEWNSVAYGNGLFVAITTEVIANRVMTSPDGINWTQRSATSTASWSAVTYGKGLFVAVGYPSGGGVLGQVATSPDGINWTNRNAAIGNNWSYVTYANGKFVAVAASGTGNRAMTSVDGINWEIQTTPVDNSWAAVTYGNGLFVAVAQAGTSASAMTSPDGITWTSRSAFADEWRDITYAKGLFVAVARSSGLGNRIMTSPDGITWTSRPSPVSNRWDAVTYGAGLFVALGTEGADNSSYITSPDGVTWTVREASASPFVTGRTWSSVVYANGMFAAVSGYGSGKVMTSGFMDKNIVPDEVFTGGLTSLNGLTVSSQTFATGKGGMDFNVSSVSGAHTFNLPDASLTSRGVLTTGLQSIAGDKNFANDLVVDGKLIARETFLRSKDISFATAVNYASAAAANGGDLADFNNDGYLDLVTPSYADNSIAISVNLNNGNGTFAAKTDYAGGRMMDARTGDFDGDGDIDIVSVDRSGTYSVFINSGNGTFAAAVNYTAVGGPDLLLVRDFNGDGKLDFVASVFGTGTVAVYMGNGNGTFASGVSYTTSIGTADGFDIADVTGDKKEDLVVVSTWGISVLPGNSNGTFGTAITKTTGFGGDMNSANVADINNDGKLDLVAGSLNQFFVYLGTGGGNFANVVGYGSGSSTKYALLYDFDGDGDMDVVAASFSTPGRVDIYTNNGAGVFAAHSNYVAGGEALIPKVADVNNDGQKDLIVINQTGDTSVLINSASPMFYAQSSSGNVGIGTATPGSKLHIAGTTTAGGHILPNVDNAYDLGSATMRFRDLYLGPASLHIGNNILSNTGGSLVWSGASIEATASATSSTEIKLTELSTNGSNYTGFKSPNILATDVLYTLPSADGTTGQSLTTNGSGGLSWVNSAVGKISTVHHSVGTALAITTTHNNAEIHAESTGGFTIDGAGFTADTFGATIVNTGGVSVTLTPSNFVGSFLRDGTTDAGFATLSIEPDIAYKLTVTNNGGSKFLNVIKFAGGGGSSQWTTSGSDVYYDTGNVAIGTSTPSASAKLLISGAVAAATAGTLENAGLVTTGSPTIDTTTATGETIIRWTGAGTFTPPTGVASVQVLVVAGGAGGGSGVSGDVRGGGGGAGGLISNSAFAVASSTSVTVTVGAGGAAAANGSDSVFSTITATGGGRGGSGAQTGFAGGSGGGGGAPAGATASFTGGTGTVGEGNNGGTGGTDGTTYRNGGGGGGAGAVGSAGSASGTGGAGTASTITSTSVTYAGGGGGGGPAATNGGAGGGGRGGAYPGGAATAGTANTGGGGGGAANGVAGAAGGSGVVIVRFTTVAAVPAGVASDNALLRVTDTGSVASATLAFFESTSGNGCVISGQTGLACSSDARLKKNFLELAPDVVDNLLKLQTVTYDWNNEEDGAGNHYGFVAQDVESLFPQLVTTDPNGKKAVNYAGFAPLLTAGLKELNTKVAVHSLQIGKIGDLVGLSTDDLNAVKLEYLTGVTAENSERFATLKAEWDALREEYLTAKAELAAEVQAQKQVLEEQQVKIEALETGAAEAATTTDVIVALEDKLTTTEDAIAELAEVNADTATSSELVIDETLDDGLVFSSVISLADLIEAEASDDVVSDPISYILERVEQGIKVARTLVAEKIVAVNGSFKRIFANELCLVDEVSGELVCVNASALKNLNGAHTTLNGLPAASVQDFGEPKEDNTNDPQTEPVSTPEGQVSGAGGANPAQEPQPEADQPSAETPESEEPQEVTEPEAGSEPESKPEPALVPAEVITEPSSGL